MPPPRLAQRFLCEQLAVMSTRKGSIVKRRRQVIEFTPGDLGINAAFEEIHQALALHTAAARLELARVQAPVRIEVWRREQRPELQDGIGHDLVITCLPMAANNRRPGRKACFGPQPISLLDAPLGAVNKPEEPLRVYVHLVIHSYHVKFAHSSARFICRFYSLRSAWIQLFGLWPLRPVKQKRPQSRPPLWR